MKVPILLNGGTQENLIQSAFLLFECTPIPMYCTNAPRKNILFTPPLLPPVLNYAHGAPSAQVRARSFPVSHSGAVEVFDSPTIYADLLSLRDEGISPPAAHTQCGGGGSMQEKCAMHLSQNSKTRPAPEGSSFPAVTLIRKEYGLPISATFCKFSIFGWRASTINET